VEQRVSKPKELRHYFTENIHSLKLQTKILRIAFDVSEHYPTMLHIEGYFGTLANVQPNGRLSLGGTPTPMERNRPKAELNIRCGAPHETKLFQKFPRPLVGSSLGYLAMT
jgi:hypothetical protein